MSKRVYQSTEKATQKAIQDYLTLKRIFHYRNNSGASVFGEGSNRRFIRFGATGSPDIVCVIKGRYIGIEVKGENGKLSDNQRSFWNSLEMAGGVYIVARSLDDVTRELKGL